MSRKNRAFAIAIATAALVGFSAPMASAATIAGPANTGFNGDSVLNVSGNQLPINACNDQVPVQGIGAQVPLQNITGLLGLLSSGNTTTVNNTASCANPPTETNTNSTDTTSTSNDPNGGDTWGSKYSHDHSNSSSDPSNTGFNNDSVLKVSGNQLPINVCNDQVPIQLIGAQVPAENVFAAIAALGSDGNTSTATQSETCSNPPTETNTGSLNT
jgi:hypothetical protein